MAVLSPNLRRFKTIDAALKPVIQMTRIVTVSLSFQTYSESYCVNSGFRWNDAP